MPTPEDEWTEMVHASAPGTSPARRDRFVRATTIPAPGPDEPATMPSIPVASAVGGSYDKILVTIEELKAGRSPIDDFERDLVAAINRNLERDRQEALAEAARPTRFERLGDE